MVISNSVIAKDDIKTIDIEYSILGSIIVDNTLAYKLDDISSNMFFVITSDMLFAINFTICFIRVLGIEQFTP